MKLDFLGLLLPQQLPLVDGEAGLTSIEHRACYTDESVKDCREQQIYMMISWVTFSDKMLLDHDSKHLLFKKKAYWSIFDCCVSLRCAAEGLNYTCTHMYIHTYAYTHIPSFLDSFSIYAITWTLLGGGILDKCCRIVRFFLLFVYPFSFLSVLPVCPHLSHKPEWLTYWN